MMPTIATYWWTAPSRDHGYHAYGPDDVRRLQALVARHTTIPHRFVCITDQPTAFDSDPDIIAVALDCDRHVPGTCYVRLQTLRDTSATTIGPRVLQLDLDALIVGSLDALFDRDEDLVMWRNPARLPWDTPTKPGRPFYNTSLLLHSPGTRHIVWQLAEPHVMEQYRDDQWFLSAALGSRVPYFDGEHDGIYRLARDDTPGSGVSGTLPENARIVFFPGSEGKMWRPEIIAANPWINAHLEGVSP